MHPLSFQNSDFPIFLLWAEAKVKKITCDDNVCNSVRVAHSGNIRDLCLKIRELHVNGIATVAVMHRRTYN